MEQTPSPWNTTCLEVRHLSEPGFTPRPADNNTGPVFVIGFRSSSEVNYITRPAEKGCGFLKVHYDDFRGQVFCSIPSLHLGFLTPFLLPKPSGAKGGAKTGQAALTDGHGDFCRWRNPSFLLVPSELRNSVTDFQGNETYYFKMHRIREVKYFHSVIEKTYFKERLIAQKQVVLKKIM